MADSEGWRTERAWCREAGSPNRDPLLRYQRFRATRGQLEIASWTARAKNRGDKGAPC